MWATLLHYDLNVIAWNDSFHYNSYEYEWTIRYVADTTSF